MLTGKDFSIRLSLTTYFLELGIKKNRKKEKVICVGKSKEHKPALQLRLDHFSAVRSCVQMSFADSLSFLTC